MEVFLSKTDKSAKFSSHQNFCFIFTMHLYACAITIIFLFIQEERLKEIQQSRNQSDSSDGSNGDVILDMRNAAGLRKPMPISYNCISCDRPVDISLRGVMGAVPQNFPAKKTMGPYTSYELDNVSKTFLCKSFAIPYFLAF